MFHAVGCMRGMDGARPVIGMLQQFPGDHFQEPGLA